MIKELMHQEAGFKVSEQIWLSTPHLGELERQYLLEACDSNWIAPLGPFVDRFEKDLAAFFGEDAHVLALNSGTAALHLALLLSGVCVDDYVLCQSFTFCASVNPIRYIGAIPVFIDSEEDTWNMDPEQLEKAILWCIGKGKKPRAIICVHLYGMPARMDDILQLAAKYDIIVIEDAAEALGAGINGHRCGTFGDFAIFSFNGNKIITTSGGGALVSKNPASIDKARYLAMQARDPVPHYQHREVGYNYRLSNLCAAIGCAQMHVLQDRILSRRENYDFYTDQLSELPGIEFQPEPVNYYSNRWLTTILLNNNVPSDITRENVWRMLKEHHIESRPLWKPMHLQPVFSRFACFNRGVSEMFFDRGLCLPSGSNMTEDDLYTITSLIRELWHN